VHGCAVRARAPPAFAKRLVFQPPLPAGVHNNLFTNINTGAGTRPWQSGGAQDRGADSGEAYLLSRGQLCCGCSTLREKATHGLPFGMLASQLTSLMTFPSALPFAGANSTWWNVYSPSRQLGLPLASGAVDCGVGPLLNWIGPFSSRWERAAGGVLGAPAVAAERDRRRSHLPSCHVCPSAHSQFQSATLSAAFLLSFPPCSVVDGMCAATRWTVDNIGAGRALYPPDLFRAMRSYHYLLQA